MLTSRGGALTTEVYKALDGHELRWGKGLNQSTKQHVNEMNREYLTFESNVWALTSVYGGWVDEERCVALSLALKGVGLFVVGDRLVGRCAALAYTFISNFLGHFFRTCENFQFWCSPPKKWPFNGNKAKSARISPRRYGLFGFKMYKLGSIIKFFRLSRVKTR